MKTLFLLITAVFFLSSCTYTLKSKRFENIKNVHITQVANATNDYTLPQIMTDALMKAFQRDNNYTVTRDEAISDAVLTVNILTYERKTLSNDSSGSPTSFKISLRIAYTFTAVLEKKELDADADYIYELVYKTESLVSDDDIKRDIIAKLADELKMQITEGF